MGHDPRGHRQLIVWQKSCDLVVMVYRATDQFPDVEKYGLTSQIRRAVISVPANITEGAGRWGSAEFQRFLSIARGSLSELEALVELALRLHYLCRDEVEPIMAQIDEVGRLLVGLRKSLTS